ncbi:MAG TPA: hypothetical protein VKD91_19190 [Pyrinomonadaceae bacterium]|nr:hypothetical protein [Pyrinomonadaceae bacterium]
MIFQLLAQTALRFLLFKEAANYYKSLLERKDIKYKPAALRMLED